MFNIFKLFNNKKTKQSPDPTEIMEVLKPFGKTAWVPIIDQNNSTCYSSKFSGIPALLKSEEWPQCKNCHEPMQLFLQLNSNHLPVEAKNPFGVGILQVFYCVNTDAHCEVECEAFFPFSKSTLVRVLRNAPDDLVAPQTSPVKNSYQEKSITGWSEKTDYPNWEELPGLGCILTEEQADLMDEFGLNLTKDKLLGWPFWVQGVEYPDCPECGKRMQFIFQIDSEDNLPFMFGDVGCSHITQCAEHREQLTIAWACC